MRTKKTATKKVSKRTSKAKVKKVTPGAEAKRVSQIEAAIKVLAKAGEPMNCKQMVEAMTKQKRWSTHCYM
jgi:hypothetical protein